MTQQLATMLNFVQTLSSHLAAWPARQTEIFEEHLFRLSVGRRRSLPLCSATEIDGCRRAIERAENDLLERLNAAYVGARHLKLPTDPPPLLEALGDDLDDDRLPKLLAARRTLLRLALDVHSQIPWAIEDRSFEPNGRAPIGEREQDIIDALRESGHRLIAVQIARKAFGKPVADGHTKGLLSGMVKRGLLTMRADTRPRGYGLPDWRQ